MPQEEADAALLKRSPARTAWRAAEVQRRYDACETLAEIAAALGISRHAVAVYRNRARRAAGISPDRRWDKNAMPPAQRKVRETRPRSYDVWLGLAPRVRTTIATTRASQRQVEAMRRIDAGEQPRAVAEAMGLKIDTVRGYQRKARIAAGAPHNPRRFTEVQKQEIRRLDELDMKPRQIADAVGLARSQVRHWLVRNGLRPVRWKTTSFTDEDRELLRSKMIAGDDRTLLMLGSWFPHSLPCLRVYLRQLRPILIAEGLLPRCECGEYLYHPLGCSAQACKSNDRGLTIVTPAKRRAVRKALLAGERIEEIMERVGLTKNQVKELQYELSPRERDRRRIVKGMGAASAGSDVGTGASVSAADLQRAIRRAMPSWLSPDQRDDVAGDVYLAMLEKRVRPAEVARVVDHFARRFERRFRLDRWSNVESLDETLGDSDDRTSHGLIGDDSMVTAVDEISLDSEWYGAADD